MYIYICIYTDLSSYIFNSSLLHVSSPLTRYNLQVSVFVALAADLFWPGVQTVRIRYGSWFLGVSALLCINGISNYLRDLRRLMMPSRPDRYELSDCVACTWSESPSDS